MEQGRLHASALGQLLVERGLMSQEQLEDALLEQRVSRKRLGAILVENRVVTPHDLTSALQIQLREVAGDTLSDPDPGEPDPPAQKRRLFRRPRRTQDNGAEPAPTTATMQELLMLTEAQNDELRRELARSSTELDTVRAELEQRTLRITELETHLKALERNQALLVGALRLEIQELEHDLRALGTVGLTASEASRTTGAVTEATGSGARDATQLMLAPNSGGGHTLRVRRGDAPPPGTVVDYDGRCYVVASHLQSPLGSDDRVCVHLQPS